MKKKWLFLFILNYYTNSVTSGIKSVEIFIFNNYFAAQQKQTAFFSGMLIYSCFIQQINTNLQLQL